MLRPVAVGCVSCSGGLMVDRWLSCEKTEQVTTFFEARTLKVYIGSLPCLPVLCTFYSLRERGLDVKDHVTCFVVVCLPCRCFDEARPLTSSVFFWTPEDFYPLSEHLTASLPLESLGAEHSSVLTFLPLGRRRRKRASLLFQLSCRHCRATVGRVG